MGLRSCHVIKRFVLIHFQRVHHCLYINDVILTQQNINNSQLAIAKMLSLHLFQKPKNEYVPIAESKV